MNPGRLVARWGVAIMLKACCVGLVRVDEFLEERPPSGREAIPGSAMQCSCMIELYPYPHRRSACLAELCRKKDFGTVTSYIHKDTRPDKAEMAGRMVDVLSSGLLPNFSRF